MGTFYDDPPSGGPSVPVEETQPPLSSSRSPPRQPQVPNPVKPRR